MKKAFFFALAAAASTHVMVSAQLATGRNINVHPGTVDQYVGDKYLQRQVEPKTVCSSTNTQHCVAIANDYRTVDATADLQSGFAEGLARLRSPAGAETRVAALPDAWLGLYRTSNGGENWLNGMVPGFSTDTSPLGASQPWYGLAAASDGGLATDGVHFYGVGLFFNRGGTSIIGAFRLTDYNDESAHPIRWDNGFSKVLESGSATSNGQFADLPSIIATPAGSCGNVYIAYTLFLGAPTNNSYIYFTRSSDCGQTYSKPLRISGNFKKSQRVVLTVDPRAGTPTTTGGGTLYAFFRTFQPDQIAFTKSLDFGKTWSSAFPITLSNGPPVLCTYDQPTKGINDGPPENESARALTFASAQVDSNGVIHAVWTERTDPATGLPYAGTACANNFKTALPRIVITSSANGGGTWTTRHAIDVGVRCETIAAPGQAAGLDRSPVNGACPPATTQRGAGPQIQPVLSHNAGKLMLMYSEGRINDSLATPAFLNSSGYHSGRNTQMDVRAASIDPLTAGLLSTTQVSQYTYDATTNDIKTVDGAIDPAGAKAYNRAYLPQYKGGTNPFKGDHDDLVPKETVVWESPAHFPTAAEVPGARFLGIWGGDNRESLFPGGSLFGSWNQYVTPGSGGASACNAGIRNSNDYVAFIGSPTEAFVHQSFKPGGGIQRTWVVTIRNRSNNARLYKLLLEEPQGNGSFDQRQDVNVIGNTDNDPFCSNGSYPACTAFRTILPNSSMTVTVFGSVPINVASPIKVDVFEATLSGGSASYSTTPSAIVRLNANPNNPAASLAGPGIGTSEHHGPAVDGPFVGTHPYGTPTPGNTTLGFPTPGNPTPGNPTPGNPTPGNPTPGNPTPGNPTPGNPTPGNAGFGDYTDYTYLVHLSDTNTTSQYAAFANIANSAEVGRSHFVQMIITRPHGVPTLNTAAAGCPEIERSDDELVSMITAPTPGNPGFPTPGNPTPGNPTPGNPTPGNTTQENPTPGNPTPGNNTFALAPQNATLTAAMFRAMALAGAGGVSSLASDLGPDGTIVGTPDQDLTRVDIRFYHCEAVGGCTLADGTHFDQETNETVPRNQNDAGSDSLIGFSADAGAGNNDNGTITDAKSAGTGPDLTIPGSLTLASTSPTTVVPGDTVQLDPWTIKNQGNAASGASSYRFFLLPSSGSSVPAGSSIPMSGLAPNDSVNGNTSVAIPNTSPGTYAVAAFADDTNTVAESNELNNLKSATPTITVCAAPTVTTASLPNGSVGQFYNQSLGASGGVSSAGACGSPTFTWSLTAGSLPPGLTLNSGGTIAGTPTTAGLYTFTVQATDQTGHSASRTLTIAVIEAVLNTDVVSAGFGGMRVSTNSPSGGTGTGTITLAGVSGTVTKALLFWNGPTSTTNPTANASVLFNANAITGTNIGFASSNCWDGVGPPPGFQNSQSYRADVTSFVTGNGSYTLANFANANADINGVSLVVFFDDGNSTNNRDVYFIGGNDSDVSSSYEPGNWNTTVRGVRYGSGTAILQLHVSDGQTATDGALSLNGTQFQAQGEIFDGTSVPNGTSGFLGWDIKSWDITTLITQNTTSDLTVTESHASDCLGLVVMMVSVPHVP